MKVLLLSSRIPYPLHDGGNMAVYSMMQSIIGTGAILSLLSMNTTKHWVAVENLPDFYEQLCHFDTVKVDNRLRPLAALANLFSRRSYNVSRFESRAFELALQRLLQQEVFDIVQVEGLYVAPYITTVRRYSAAKIVYRQHNIEFSIWEKLATNATFKPKKWYLSLLAKRLKRYELKMLNAADLILPISAIDAVQNTALGLRIPQATLPYGITDSIGHVPPIHRPLRFYHIGAMDWQPNKEGVQWLLEQVWPQVLERYPAAELHLAGRNMAATAIAVRGVQLHGEVPDAKAWESEMDVLLVPLQSAGGLRIKTLSAMAQGKAVVSTAVGAAGIAATDGIDMMIAHNAQDFATAMLRLLQHESLAPQLAANALALIASSYSSASVSLRLGKAYHALLGR